MAVKIKQLSKWLKENDFKTIKHKVYKKQKRIVFVVSDDEYSNLFILETKEKGALCIWEMYLLNREENKGEKFPKDHPNLLQVMQYALMMDNERKFGRWEYDPEAEKMIFSVNIVLEDAIMTYNQFKRILGLMLSNATSEAEALRTILVTGEFPQSNNHELFKLLESFVEKHSKDKETVEILDS
jgi:hypothetical protein